jgi:hypothetical protein
MIKILDGSYTRLAALKNVLDANRLETINGENTLDFSAIFDGRVAEFVNENTIYELDDEYFDTALITKAANDDGMFTVAVEAEHISYRLNDPAYNVQWFTEMGLPSYILGKILEGTGFTIGTVEFTTVITYSAQEAKSRRQLLMELVAYVGGEISFNKFEVSILAHRGSTEVTSVIKDRNVKVVSKTVDKRQKDEDGNYLVSYMCTPIFIPGDSYTLGDNVVLLQKTLGLSEQLRVVSISRNPYDEMQTTLEFANYTNGLESSLFRIETNTLTKGKTYYGARISPEYGFESIRSDLKARTVMNADTFEMQVGDGTGLWYKKLWFDPELGLYIFDGTLSAETIEALKAEIDVVVSNTIIVNNLTAQKGNIAELTVDQIDTSDKVQRYLLPDINPLRKGKVNYWRGYDQNLEFVEAICIGSEEKLYQSWTGYPDSPVLCENYPYQTIFTPSSGTIYLFVSTKSLYRADEFYRSAEQWTYELFTYNGVAWVFAGTGTVAESNTVTLPDPPVQANFTIHGDEILSTVYFAKTTTPSQDAHPGGTSEEQVTNRFGEPLYWIDDTKTGITEDVTSWPVMQFVYHEDIKLKIFHEIDPETGYANPKIVLGAGNQSGKMKGYIYKDSDELVIAYETSAGEMREIRLGENGIFITPYDLESIVFSSAGFAVKYSGETYNWTWAKDGTGKITSLTNEDGTVPVTWG